MADYGWKADVAITDPRELNCFHERRPRTIFVRLELG